MTKVFDAVRYFHLQGRPGGQPAGSESTSEGPAFEMDEIMISLYQGIEALLPVKAGWVIQFVGSREGEGTSTIVGEFSRAVADRLGKKVLVVDGDRQKPSQGPIFGVSPAHPLQEVLSGSVPLEKALCPVSGRNVTVALLSHPSASAPEIFDNPGAADLLDRLREDFNIVIIDSPPITVLPDCLAISSRVDGVVLVVEAETTRWPIAEKVKQRIIKNRGNLLGTILNKRRYYIPEWIYRRL